MICLKYIFYILNEKLNNKNMRNTMRNQLFCFLNKQFAYKLRSETRDKNRNNNKKKGKKNYYFDLIF